MRFFVNRTTLAAFACIELGISSVSAAHADSFARAVDVICKQTGLRRDGQIKLLRRSKYADLRYRVEVALVVDGRKRLYTVLLDDNFKMVEFQPEGWPFVPGGLIKYPPGYDTYREPNGRQMALSAVTRFNQLRNYKPYGQPAIQKVGAYLLVTYQWTSKQRRGTGVLYKDAVLSFIVTSRGTVCGQLWGTWPTNGKWPLLRLTNR
jgi:hypothetical protein